MQELLNGIINLISTIVWLITAIPIIGFVIKKVKTIFEDYDIDENKIFIILGIAALICIAMLIISHIIIFAIFRALIQ